MTNERTLATDLWRLAEEAERRGIRILVEAISGEHYATSFSEANTIYRLTGFSCTCRGFMRWQRCTHHSLLLAQLGWLPDVEDDPDDDPDPDSPGAAVRPAEVVCMTCRGLGREEVTTASGATVWVPCSTCGGTRETESPIAISVSTIAAPWEEERSSAAAEVAPVPAPERSDAIPVPIPFTRREDRARELTQTVEEAIASLAEQLAQGHTDEYLAVLAFYSKFHRYSLPNTLLIRRQRPDASLVAGLKRWNEVGYRVRAGEKAVWIWAPMVKKDVNAVTGDEEERVVGFRPAPVFADCQLANLEEKPLPSLFRPLPDDCEDLYEGAKRRVIATGIAVEEHVLPGGIHGASTGGRILIRTDLDSRSRLLVLAHELAHELAHHGEAAGDTPLPLRELEAESVAFVVGRVLGVDSPFSSDYLSSYGLDAPALQAALVTIQTLVRQVVAIIRPDEDEVESRQAA